MKAARVEYHLPMGNENFVTSYSKFGCTKHCPPWSRTKPWASSKKRKLHWANKVVLTFTPFTAEADKGTNCQMPWRCGVNTQGQSQLCNLDKSLPNRTSHQQAKAELIHTLCVCVRAYIVVHTLRQYHEEVIKTIFLTVANNLGSSKGQLARPQRHLPSESVLHVVNGASSCQKPQGAKAVWLWMNDC